MSEILAYETQKITVEYLCTCDACPTQYSGTIDGTPFYFRFRYGHYSLTLYTDCGDREWAGSFGDEWAGEMSHLRVKVIIAHAVIELWPGVQIEFLKQ